MLIGVKKLASGACLRRALQDQLQAATFRSQSAALPVSSPKETLAVSRSASKGL